MKLQTVILVVAFLSSGCFAQGNDNPDVPGFFEVKLGQPFPGKPSFPLSSDYPVPLYSFLVPIGDDSKIPFHDYQVSALSNSGKVRGVSATRAFSSSHVCREKMDLVKPLIKRNYPQVEINKLSMQPYKQGDLILTFGCSIAEGAYFYVLFLSISSEALTKEVERQFDR